MTHSSTILNPPPIPNTRPFLARFITYRRRVQLPRPPHPAPRATMSTTSESTPLDDIFKQKKALRTKVRRELKSMDSNLRSQEGDIFGCLNVGVWDFLLLAFLCTCIGFFLFVSISDDAIQNIVLEAPWFRSCKRLCAYISCSALREVDTSRLLAEILENSSEVGFSLCFLSFLWHFFFVVVVVVVVSYICFHYLKWNILCNWKICEMCPF